jgi:hypothetical protein
MLNIRFGAGAAGAASRCGSGFTKMRGLLAAPVPQHCSLYSKEKIDPPEPQQNFYPEPPENDAAPRHCFTAVAPSLQCPLGYSYNRQMHVCDDINECEEVEKQNSACAEGETCHNTIGKQVRMRTRRNLSNQYSLG